MRIGALVPALGLAAALVAPPTLDASPDGGRDRRGRSAYDRSARGRGNAYRSGRRSYRDGYRRGSRRGYHRGQRWSPRYARRPYPAYRSYPRPYPRPYGYRYRYRPAPPVYYVPRPVPYGVPVWPPPYRHGIHGGITIGVPGFGLSLFF
jgi:hypothetical protein